MMPKINGLIQEISETTYPNRTYKIQFYNQEDGTTPQLTSGVVSLSMSSEVEVDSRISGYVDDLEALTQTIYLILMTERYKFLIYSWDYGVELVDLFGQPMPYVIAELPRRIQEALTQDNRIDDVTDFEFNISGRKLHTKFTVVSKVGKISTDMEVNV